jgi:hypothetical protein
MKVALERMPYLYKNRSYFQAVLFLFLSPGNLAFVNFNHQLIMTR